MWHLGSAIFLLAKTGTKQVGDIIGIACEI